MAKFKSDRTEVFYHCDPNKATTCPKSHCAYYGRGKCSLTMNPSWGTKLVSADCPGRSAKLLEEDK